MARNTTTATEAPTPTPPDETDPESRRSVLERMILNHTPAYDAGDSYRYEGASREDRPRNEGRVRIKVQPSPYCPVLLSLPGGWVVAGPARGPDGPPAPPTVLFCYTSELSAIMQHVADFEEPARLAAARDLLANTTAEAMRNHFRGTGHALDGLKRAEVRKLIEAGEHDDELRAALAGYHAEEAPAMVACFQALHEASPAALASVEILEQMPAPKSPGDLHREQSAVDNAPAIAAAMAAVFAPLAAKFDALITALTERK